jgi:putative transposase
MSMKVLEREQRFISSAEMQKYLNGSSKEGLVVGSAVFNKLLASMSRAASSTRNAAWYYRRAHAAYF